MAEQGRPQGRSESALAEHAGLKPPTISLPKGGGAIRGIGEKFAANPVTGTASMSVPIATSPGRSGFGPQLALSYDSGAGNGPFGFGWQLQLPGISRKTDKGLPRYHDEEESDVYILSGAEDLVPVLTDDADRPDSIVRTVDGVAYRVQPYRPRIEGLFARIERWTAIASGDTHWRSIARDNVTTHYGRTAASRIADPADPTRIFSWLICESYDDKGHATVYEYVAEDSEGIDASRPEERNRTDKTRSANRYLKRVKYGNLQSRLVEPDLSRMQWLFEAVLDYDDGHYADLEADAEGRQFVAATPAATRPWTARLDAFSNYRPTFEVRTYRLCRRVLMFHRFPEELGTDAYLVRSTEFAYRLSPVAAFITSVIQSGYVHQPAAAEANRYLRKSIPPVEFTYSEAQIDDAVRTIDAESVENLPEGVDGSRYQWVDLDGEGVAGILTEQGTGWFYKRNVSPACQPDGAGHGAVRFAPAVGVATKPASSLNGPAQLMDLAGDGQLDVVQFGAPAPGFYERTDDAGWAAFRTFTQFPNVDTQNPNLRFVDLDGDGRPDMLIADDRVFSWHRSLGENGYGPAARVFPPADDERSPRLVFGDGTQSIYIADMSGDGLSDLVRIQNGHICYWPNLGYGRFGAKVTMAGAPWFDAPDKFDHRRVRVGDTDGSGTTDIFYLGDDGVTFWRNQAGNSWSEPVRLRVFPPTDRLTSVTVVDLLGNGTACLVWSSPQPGDARRQLRYVDLMGGQKPHLLVGATNNLGSLTRVHYVPSTKFQAADRLAGTPWVTRLPFPVHVVERVEKYDHVSRTRFVTRFAYHHGCYDGVEREFRGWGRVDQWDTEEFATLVTEGELPRGDNVDRQSHLPPILTKTWYHTGVHLKQPADEYFREPGSSAGDASALLLPDAVLPAGLTVEEEREAVRALKGSVLRREVYAEDAGPGATDRAIERARTPYSVVEQSFGIQRLQRTGPNRHAVFAAHPSEWITYHYERDPADPRVHHTLVLEVDEFGNVLKDAAVFYGRRAAVRVRDVQGHWQVMPNPHLQRLLPDDRAKQQTALMTYTESRFTNSITAPDANRTPLACEARTFELIGYVAGRGSGRFQRSDLVEPDPDNDRRLRLKFRSEIAFESTITTGEMMRRPRGCMRMLYRRDDLTGLLPLGEVQAQALPGESYRLALTPGLLATVFQRDGEPLLPDPAAVLEGQTGSQGGYLRGRTLSDDGRFPAGDADDGWWTASGRSYFTPDPADTSAAELEHAQRHFFLTRRQRDAFGQDTVIGYDSRDLLTVETRDALGNRAAVESCDYRTLQPRIVCDPNGNRTEVVADALGLVVGSAIMGKSLPAPAEGDTLAGFSADPAPADIQSFFDSPNPRAAAGALLGNATTRFVYDVDRFYRTQRANPNDASAWQPACSANMTRETHAADPVPSHGLRVQLSVAYSDGFGRQIQTKVPAEAGPVTETGPAIDPRWVGTGWTIYNNKGKPVRQYEPFFSATHRFEFGVTAGVSPILFYDPAERVIATLHPNHTYVKTVFDPWQHTTYDVNDTCAPRNAETGDPRTDADIAGYAAEYFKSQPADWRTWHARRHDGSLGPHEQAAALSAAAHADTPVTAVLDAAGRTCLTVERNRTICPGHERDGIEEQAFTRSEFDVEGNQLAVRDALQQGDDPSGRVVVLYTYDLLGTRLRQSTMDGGTRWLLNDATGKPVRVWDSRGHVFTTTYDALRRPVEHRVRGTSAASDPRTHDREILFDKTEYGEGHPGAESLNLRMRVFRHFDTAGVVVNARLDADGDPIAAYDFKGNLLGSVRQFAADWKTIPDWQTTPPLAAERFESRARYDALNRAVQAIAPHSNRSGHGRSVLQPVFNEANLLERLDVWLDREEEPEGLLDAANEPAAAVGIAGVEYDAKGQRLRIDYKNGVSTRYTYDAETLRLVGIDSGRDASAGDPHVQGLRYTYDPAGNITHIEDDAQQSAFFRNQHVGPERDYIHDALYRLIQATGREHLGQAHDPATPPDAFNRFHTSRDQPGDGSAMGRYVERYVYDAVGNFMRMQHRGSDPRHAGWTRAYRYAETNNRLRDTTLQPDGDGPPQIEAYEHDVHGNIVRMPHLGQGMPAPNMHWNFQDHLERTDQGGGGMTYYVYDAAGGRLRKMCEKNPGVLEERLYLGGFEIFRRHAGAIGPESVTLERETLHVMDGSQRLALVESRTIDVDGTDAALPRVIRYQLADHLGSASLELDDHAGIVSYEEYAPYGTSTYQAVRSQTETPKRYRFTGKERDEESGFYYHGARYYAPWIGRWTSADPAGLADGPNRYAYGRNSPITRVDKDGRQSELFDEFENILDNMTAGNYRRIKMKLNIDEIDAVRGNAAGGVAGSPSDPANKQFLDNMTNQATKGNRVGPAPHRRPSTSFAADPDGAANRTITGAFDEVDEIRQHADDATQATRQGLRTNSSLWRRLRANPTIVNALRRIGVDLESGTFFNPLGRDQFPKGDSVNFSPRDADLDPRTGQVIDGPNTRAALQRREARQAANQAAREAQVGASAEARAAATTATQTVSAEVRTATTLARTEVSALSKLRAGGSTLLHGLGGWSGVAFKGLWVLNAYFAWEGYNEGVNARTIAPAGPAEGLAVGSTGEGVMNAVGQLAGGANVGTMLREAGQAGSQISNWDRFWNAVTGGSSPVSIGMGMAMGDFRR